ncbi:unnamed protein product, partial [Prorocentrum cordatum]
MRWRAGPPRGSGPIPTCFGDTCEDLRTSHLTCYPTRELSGDPFGVPWEEVPVEDHYPNASAREYYLGANLIGGPGEILSCPEEAFTTQGCGARRLAYLRARGGSLGGRRRAPGAGVLFRAAQACPRRDKKSGREVCVACGFCRGGRCAEGLRGTRVGRVGQWRGAAAAMRAGLVAGAVVALAQVQMRTAQCSDDTSSKARLDAYDRGHCTSRGQISEVYLGVHLETGIPVALKKTARFGDLQEAVQRECEMEAGLLMALDHPHLIRYHEHFLHEGDLYLVMEPAMGGTLAQKVESARSLGSPMDEALLWRWLSDVSSALVYLHRRRVLHRDIKPSHVFLGQDGAAKLGDFGLSRELQTATQCALSCVGTPFYMSPEIVKGEGYAFASDVWSLGCTLYECAMFFSPFYRSDMDFMALGSAICSASYRPLPPDQWTQ